MNAKKTTTPAVGTGEGQKVSATQFSAASESVPRREVNSTTKASAHAEHGHASKSETKASARPDSKAAPTVRTIGTIKDHSQRHGPIIPDDIIDLGPKAMAVYAATKRFLHREDGDCHPAIETICKKGHVSRRTVEKYRPIIAGIGEWIVHMKSGCRTYYEFPDYPLTFTPWQKKKKKSDPGKRAQGNEQSDTRPRQTSTGYPGKRAQGTPVNEHTEPIETNQWKLTNSPVAPNGGQGGIDDDESNPLTPMMDSSFGETATGKPSRLPTAGTVSTRPGDGQALRGQADRQTLNAPTPAQVAAVHDQVVKAWNGKAHHPNRERCAISHLMQDHWAGKAIVAKAKRAAGERDGQYRGELDYFLEDREREKPPMQPDSPDAHTVRRFCDYVGRFRDGIMNTAGEYIGEGQVTNARIALGYKGTEGPDAVRKVASKLGILNVVADFLAKPVPADN